MLHRSLAALAVVALAAIVVPSALAVRVHVRVEGRTQTIFGASEPRLDAALRCADPRPGVTECPAGPPTPLHALEVASRRGEFYYRLAESSFGPYVDQIGRHPAGGASGWAFKVNGASPPVGANAVQLEDGDRVLWYWATFGSSGGPPTLRLARERRAGCYRVSKQDDQGRASVAAGAILRVDGRGIRTRRGRACVGPHRGLVRATLRGAVRSNALR